MAQLAMFSVIHANHNLPPGFLERVAFVGGTPSPANQLPLFQNRASLTILHPPQWLKFVDFASNEKVRLLAYGEVAKKRQAMFMGWQEYQMDSRGFLQISFAHEGISAFVAWGEQSGTVYAQDASGNFIGFKEAILAGGQQTAAFSLTSAAATEKSKVSTPLIVTGVATDEGGQLPVASPTAPTAVPTLSIAGVHIVLPGETLDCIGRAYGVLPDAITAVNGINFATTPGVGQPLRIPFAQWTNISAGPVCQEQFPPPFPVLPQNIPTPPPQLPTTVPVPTVQPTNTPIIFVPPTNTPIIFVWPTNTPIVFIVPTITPIIFEPPTDIPTPMFIPVSSTPPPPPPPTNTPTVVPPTNTPTIVPPTNTPTVVPPTNTPFVPPVDTPTRETSPVAVGTGFFVETLVPPPVNDPPPIFVPPTDTPTPEPGATSLPPGTP